jgi:hypothetical protein
MLEPGEFVLRKAAVDRMGLDSAVKLNSTGDMGGDVNIEVNIVNNGALISEEIISKRARRENGKIIVDVILEDIRNNGPIKQTIKGLR